MSVHKDAKRITTQVVHEMKQSGEKIAMLTAYDYTMATVVDQAGVDIILVGDSASNVMAGHETTLPITLPTSLGTICKLMGARSLPDRAPSRFRQLSGLIPS